jgi:acyl-phosphate glycerol 3-phosphate acyltransferase
MRTNGLFIVLIFLSYLFGSINFAILATYIKCGADIREIGNHNPGAANVFRSVDKRFGILVGILDGSKGFILLIFAKWVGAPNTVLLLISAAAILGHNYPIFYHFKGGTGLSTTMGCALFFAPKEMLLIMLFLIPLGYFLHYIKEKMGSNLSPGGVCIPIFYIYFLLLVFIPSISNEVKVFSLIVFFSA